MELYDMIFKRKSFHIFNDILPLSAQDMDEINAAISSAQPLYPDIRTKIVVVPENETTCRRGAEYCILFYSEKKGDYLRNIGYLGEQIDLFLAAANIGTLWFGIGKPHDAQIDGLDYVIMIALAKMPEARFRKEMFRAKRKPLTEIWSGEILPFADILRFAPSACNTQPWFTEHRDGVLHVFRYKKPGKRGIMPADKVVYYNRIDIGIYLLFLETCLCHDGIAFVRELISDTDETDETMIPAAKYRLKDQQYKTEQVARIEKYESMMRRAQKLLVSGLSAPGNAEELRSLCAALDSYYTGGLWKQDYADDEAGLLPPDLLRGVLSQDGLYDLLEECGELLKEI